MNSSFVTTPFRAGCWDLLCPQASQGETRVHEMQEGWQHCSGPCHALVNALMTPSPPDLVWAPGHSIRGELGLALTPAPPADEATLALMKTPRCSLPDLPAVAPARRRRQAPAPTRWNKRNLSWRWVAGLPCPGLSVRGAAGHPHRGFRPQGCVLLVLGPEVQGPILRGWLLPGPEGQSITPVPTSLLSWPRPLCLLSSFSAGTLPTDLVSSPVQNGLVSIPTLTTLQNPRSK